MLNPIWQADGKSMVQNGPWIPLLWQTLDTVWEPRGKAKVQNRPWIQFKGTLEIEHAPWVLFWRQFANPRCKPNFGSHYGGRRQIQGPKKTLDAILTEDCKAKVQKGAWIPFLEATLKYDFGDTRHMTLHKDSRVLFFLLRS